MEPLCVALPTNLLQTFKKVAQVPSLQASSEVTPRSATSDVVHVGEAVQPLSSPVEAAAPRRLPPAPVHLAYQCSCSFVSSWPPSRFPRRTVTPNFGIVIRVGDKSAPRPPRYPRAALAATVAKIQGPVSGREDGSSSWFFAQSNRPITGESHGPCGLTVSSLSLHGSGQLWTAL